MRHPTTRCDLEMTLAVLAELERGCGRDDTAAFARRLMAALDGFVAPEFSTVSVCRIRTGFIRAAGLRGATLPAAHVKCAGCRFYGRPLGCLRGLARCLSDELPTYDFGRNGLFADRLRSIGIDRVIAVPVQVEAHRLVSLVLTRSRDEFSARERARVELLRPHLSFFYRQACRVARESATDDAGQRMLPGDVDAQHGTAIGDASLTPREVQVLQWLAFGKTDAEIAALLGVSTRTVHKHLEHVYVKLGVETRTAAVMRALHIDPARLRLH